MQARYLRRINEKGIIVQDFRFDKESGQLQQNDPPKPIGRVIESENSDLTDKQPHFGESLLRLNLKLKTAKPATFPFERELGISFITFVTIYLFHSVLECFLICFNIGLPQKVRSFRLTVIAHPLCIMVVWVPCVLVGAWASGFFLQNSSTCGPFCNVIF